MWQARPSLAAAAAVWRAWLDWVAPWVMTMSAPWARAAAIRNSSLRVLLPPVERPVQSSRLIQSFGPPRWRERFSMGSSGVGRWPSRTRGKRARFMTAGFLRRMGRRDASRDRRRGRGLGTVAFARPYLQQARRRLCLLRVSASIILRKSASMESLMSDDTPQRRGGKARAERLSPEERKKIAS